MRVWPARLIALCLCTACRQGGPAPSNLEGVWRIGAIRSEAETDTTSNADPQPSLVIFTRQHYSMVRIPGWPNTHRILRGSGRRANYKHK